MVLKAEVLEILEEQENKIVVFASYCRGHKALSPRGFEFTFERKEQTKVKFPNGKEVLMGRSFDDIKVGMIWDLHWGPYGKVTKYPKKSAPLLGEIPSDEFFRLQMIENIKRDAEERVERRAQIKKNKAIQILGLVEAIKNKKL